MGKDAADKLILFLITAAFMCISIAVVAIPAIIIFVVSLIVLAIVKYTKNKKAKKDIEIINSSADDFMNSLKLSIKEIKNEGKSNLDLISRNNQFVDYFEPKIMERGEKYFYENRVKNIKNSENSYNCIVEGNEDYHVSLILDDDVSNKIESATCTCRYYTDTKRYCKHIYALLCKVKYKELLKETKTCYNIKGKVLNEIKNRKATLLSIIKSYSHYYEKNQENIPVGMFEVNKYNIIMDHYSAVLDKLEVNIKKAKSNNEAIKLYLEFFRTCEKIFEYENLFYEKEYKVIENDKSYKKILDDYSRKYYKEYYTEDEDEEDDEEDDEYNEEFAEQSNNKKISLLELLGSKSDDRSRKENNKSEFTEEEMDFYGLYDYEREEVRKGEWAPWSFEKPDDGEDDEYYYNDDGEDDDL